MVSSLKIYSYVKCGTCKKAISWLKSNNIEFKLLDIIENPPSRDSIIEAISQLGDIKYLLNTSGKSYRSIGAGVIKSMPRDKVIQLLISDSKLLKRPFLISDKGRILVGFNEDKWIDTLLI